MPCNGLKAEVMIKSNIYLVPALLNLKSTGISWVNGGTNRHRSLTPKKNSLTINNTEWIAIA